MNLGSAFGSCETSKSLVWGGFGALAAALVMFVPRGLMTFRQFMNGVTEGFKTMIPACCILFQMCIRDSSMAVSCTQGQPKWARQILRFGRVAASSSNSVGLEYLVSVLGSQESPLWKIIGFL